MGVPSISGNEPPAPVPASGTRMPLPRSQDTVPTESTPERRKRPEHGQDTASQAMRHVDPPVRRAGTRLRVDDASKRIVTQIVNEHNEVLRQIPPEELLKVLAQVRRLQGLLLDEHA